MLDLERELLLNSLPGMAYRCQVEAPWTMHYVSSGVRFVCSYGPEDFISGKVKWGDLIHRDHLKEIDQELQHALDHRRHFNFHYRIVDPELGVRWMNEAGQGIYGSDGRVEALVGFIIDVTAQAEVQAKLKEAEQRYALAATATGEIIWDRDIDTNEVRRIIPDGSPFSDAADEASLSHSWWEERVHPEDAPVVRQAIEELLSAGRNQWSCEYRLRRSDGSYAHIYDQGFLLPTETSGGKRRMVGAMQDISERKEAEAQLEQLQAELIHISQNSAMSAMAATIAHELNQPLAAAANYLTGSRRMVVRKIGDQDPAVAGLDEAEHQIQRAGEIIRRMRSLVSRSEDRRETVSLRHLVSRVRRLLSASGACPKLRLQVQIDEDADNLHVDPVQIEQVFINLLRNSCEAMTHLDVPKVLITSVRREPHLLEITVLDQGGGLSDASLATLFTAYGASETGGLGVGLSICRTIVEAHGGRIWAENAANDGAAFHLTLPTEGKHNHCPDDGGGSGSPATAKFALETKSV